MKIGFVSNGCTASIDRRKWYPVWFRYSYGVIFGPGNRIRWEGGPILGLRIFSMSTNYNLTVSDPAQPTKVYTHQHERDGSVVFDYGLGASLKIKLADHRSLSSGYRYVRSTGADFKSEVRPLGTATTYTYFPYKYAEHGTHFFSVGVEYRFRAVPIDDTPRRVSLARRVLFSEKSPMTDAPAFALKEWAVVCDLLADGHIALLPRKGGIREWGGPGVFELEHRDFFLFPTREHEKTDRIKPGFLARAPKGGSDGDTVTLGARATAEKIWRVPSRAAFDRLDDLHPWLPPAIDMRFDYKPENPLYLVALRVRRTAAPLAVPHWASYRGCRSWVPLEPGDIPSTIDEKVSMDDARFAGILERVNLAFAL